MKISVVIPAYNSERFIGRCLESVFNQTLKPTEVIVVDDGSNDKTADIAEGLGARVIRSSNHGTSVARNRGIHESSNDWVALLDADDLWSPDKLERQAACIRPDTVLVYTGLQIFDDSGVRELRSATDVGSARNMLRYCNPILPSSVLIRRSALIQVGGFRPDIRGVEDWDMWVRLRDLGNFEALPNPATHYYVYPKSLSANPYTMLKGLEGILETTLVADLRGFKRWAWKQRIRAVQFRSAGLIARENGLRGELRFMLLSLCAWPSPFWQRNRFAALAVSAKNRFL